MYNDWEKLFQAIATPSSQIGMFNMNFNEIVLKFHLTTSEIPLYFGDTYSKTHIRMWIHPHTDLHTYIYVYTLRIIYIV